MAARGGFTLIEALFAVATLAFLAGGLVVLYGSGQQSLSAQADEAMLCSVLRSRMERAIALPFESHAGSVGVHTVDILGGGGRIYTGALSVAHVDLDGDDVVETNAVTVTVTISGRSLTVLRVDDQDRLGKH